MEFSALNVALSLTLVSGLFFNPGDLFRAQPAGDGSRGQSCGLEGRLYLIGGNRMPSPPRYQHEAIRNDSTRKDNARDAHTRDLTKGPGVKGTVCVFELTNDRQVTRHGTSPYCEAVHTKLICQVETDDKGNFRIPLPPGNYSVFTRKGNLFYATRRDEQNNIAPVKVMPGEMTRLDIGVESDQKALY